MNEQIPSVIIPATANAKSGGIEWYDVSEPAHGSGVQIIGRGPNGDEVAKIQVYLEGKGKARFRLSGIGPESSGQLSVLTTGTGAQQAKIVIDGVEHVLSSGDEGARHLVVTDEQRRQLSPWIEVEESLRTAARALVATAGGRWRTTSCALLAAGTFGTGVACGAGALPSCAAFFLAAATFEENCDQ